MQIARAELLVTAVACGLDKIVGAKGFLQG